MTLILRSACDLGTLDRALRQFAGFSCIFKRVGEWGDPGTPRTNPDEDFLHNNPKLPMKLFVCRSMRGVRLEEQQFQRLKAHLDLDVWPAKGKMGNAKELAGHIWRTDRTTGLTVKEFPDQVHHFASHYTANHIDSEKHFFTLGESIISEFDVRLGDMTGAFGRLSKHGFPAAHRRPLVFVNACDSSRTCADRISSLPGLFLTKLKSRGFIGTETTISDDVAAEFSYQFYLRLLSGARLGEALHDARWFLVRHHHNFLGLFYTCYANPELRVSHPI